MFHNIVSDNVQPFNLNVTHNIRKRDFISLINKIKILFNIIPLSEYIDKYIKIKKKPFSDISITFDDGTSSSINNGAVELEKLNIPCSVFLSTCQLTEEKILDGYYLAALCFNSNYSSILIDNKTFNLISISERLAAYKMLKKNINYKFNAKDKMDQLKYIYPLTEKQLSPYSGVTIDDLNRCKRSNRIEICSHGHRHISLSNLNLNDQHYEISKSIEVLQSISNICPKYFSYPYGEYDIHTIDIVKKCGFEASFAVANKGIASNILYEIPRVGIYNSKFLYLFLKFLKNRIDL